MNLEKIGKFLKEKRKEKGLTQESFAEKLGVSNRSISKWENGKCLPDISLYNDICNILSISLTEFIMGEEVKENIKVKESDQNINNVINEVKEKNSTFDRIIRLCSYLSIIFSIFLYSNNKNGMYLLLIFILLSTYLGMNKIKKSFVSIKNNKSLFIDIILFISFTIFNIYLFWLHTIYFFILSIYLVLIAIILSIKNKNYDVIIYIMVLVLFYAFSYLLKIYISLL